MILFTSVIFSIQLNVLKNLLKIWKKTISTQHINKLVNLNFFIYSFPQIDIDNNYDNLFVVNTIKNPKVANFYSKKLFAGAVNSFGIMRDRIFGEFFNGFDDSLAVFRIEFFDEILCRSVQKNLKHIRVPVLS